MDPAKKNKVPKISLLNFPPRILSPKTPSGDSPNNKVVGLIEEYENITYRQRSSSVSVVTSSDKSPSNIIYDLRKKKSSPKINQPDELSQRKKSEKSLNNKISIEEVVNYIVHHKLDLKHIDTKKWINTLKDNLIVNIDILKELSDTDVNKLNLPIILEIELKRVIASESSFPEIKNYPGNVFIITDEIKRDIINYCDGILNTQRPVSVCLSDTSDKPQHILYDKFADVYPSKDRYSSDILDKLSIASKAKKLFNILHLIKVYISDPVKAVSIFKKIAISHTIYDLHKRNFDMFSQTFVDSLPNLSADNRQILSMLLAKISAEIIGYSEVVKSGNDEIYLVYKTKKNLNTRWKQYYCKIKLNIIVFCTDSTFEKIKYEYSIKSIDEIEILKDDELPTGSMQYCVSFSTTSDEVIYINTINSNDMNSVVDALRIRKKAHEMMETSS